MTPSFPAFNPISAGKARAFTLVELLVAVAVSVIVIGMLSNVSWRGLQISQHTSESMTAVNSAAAAIDLIACDLDSLASTRQNYEFLRAQAAPAAYNGIQPMTLMLNAWAAQDSGIPVVIGSVSSYPNSGQALAVCYRIVFQDPLNAMNGTRKVLGLYRSTAMDTSLSNPNTTAASFAFANFLGQTDLGLAWDNYWKGTLPPVTDFVAPNVIDLQLAFYSSLTYSGANPTPSYTGTTALNAPAAGETSAAFKTFRISGNGYTVGAGSPSTGQPTVAEISVTVLEAGGAALWGDGSGTGAAVPDALRRKYGHTLTRRVQLRLAN